MARHAHWLCCLNAQTGSWSVMIHGDVKDCRMGGDPFNVYWHIQPDLPLKLLTKNDWVFSGLFLSLCSLSRCFSSFLSLFFLLVFLLTATKEDGKLLGKVFTYGLQELVLLPRVAACTAAHVNLQLRVFAWIQCWHRTLT